MRQGTDLGVSIAIGSVAGRGQARVTALVVAIGLLLRCPNDGMASGRSYDRRTDDGTKVAGWAADPIRLVAAPDQIVVAGAS